MKVLQFEDSKSLEAWIVALLVLLAPAFAALFVATWIISITFSGNMLKTETELARNKAFQQAIYIYDPEELVEDTVW